MSYFFYGGYPAYGYGYDYSPYGAGVNLSISLGGGGYYGYGGVPSITIVQCAYCRKLGHGSPSCPERYASSISYISSTPSISSSSSSSYASYSSSSSSRITILDSSDSKFQEIKSQFDSQWTHPASEKPKGTVYFISAITMPHSISSKHEEYKNRIASSGVTPYGNGGPGNTLRRFHGTKHECTIGSRSTDLCSSSYCFVCLIIKHGFDMSKSSSGRYGKGIYTSATSSKSNDYTNTNTSTGFKAMLVCSVVCGNPHKPTSSAWGPVSLPYGYHSVVGDPQYDRELNYDELVCYNNEAVLPSYLIIYR